MVFKYLQTTTWQRTRAQDFSYLQPWMKPAGARRVRPCSSPLLGQVVPMVAWLKLERAWKSGAPTHACHLSKTAWALSDSTHEIRGWIASFDFERDLLLHPIS